MCLICSHIPPLCRVWGGLIVQSTRCLRAWQTIFVGNFRADSEHAPTRLVPLSDRIISGAPQLATKWIKSFDQWIPFYAREDFKVDRTHDKIKEDTPVLFHLGPFLDNIKWTKSVPANIAKHGWQSSGGKSAIFLSACFGINPLQTIQHRLIDLSIGRVLTTQNLFRIRLRTHSVPTCELPCFNMADRRV